MNILDKRELILKLQQAMLINETAQNDNFLSLVAFENWCCNSGLSGFVQDFSNSDLHTINNFAAEHSFITVAKMISVVRKYQNLYGHGFSDNLSEDEYEDLSQYDDDFYEMQDLYTDAIYKEYIENK